MPDPRQEEMPVTEIGYENDDIDVVVSYSVLEGSMNDLDNLVISGRRIEASVIDERDTEIEVKLEITDNTNQGVFALGSAFENHPGGEFEQFTETVVFEKSDIPYYQDDFLNEQVRMALGERIIPPIQDWSDSEPFRA